MSIEVDVTPSEGQRDELRALLAGRAEPVVVGPEDPAVEAMARMLEHGYSQLPVVETAPEGKRVLGLVSTTGIARACLHLDLAPSRLRVRHALDEDCGKVYLDQHDVWKALDLMPGDGVVLVLDDADCLQGILTAADFADHLRERTQDGITVADVESTLKQLVRERFGDDDAALAEAVREQVTAEAKRSQASAQRMLDSYLRAAAPGSSIDKAHFAAAFQQAFLDGVDKGFEDLTFGNYAALFIGPCWSKYEPDLALPKDAVRGLLDKVRGFRNRLAHQRGGLLAPERDQLRYVARLLGELADRAEPLAETPFVFVPPAEQFEVVAGAPATQPDDPVSAGIERLLSGQSPQQLRVRLSFDDLDQAVGGGLPVDARQHRSWWSNDAEHPQAAAWLDAGWRVARVNLSRGAVEFARNSGLEKAYLDAFNVMLHALESVGVPSRGRSAMGRSWHTLAYLPEQPPTSATVNLVFTHDGRFRVEVYVDAGDKATNKATFDALRTHEVTLEEQVGQALDWDRRDARRAARVSAYFSEPVRIRTGEEDLSALVAWVKEVTPRFLAAFRASYRLVVPTGATTTAEAQVG